MNRIPDLLKPAIVLALTACLLGSGCAKTAQERSDENLARIEDRQEERPSVLSPDAQRWKRENSQCEVPGNAANWQTAYCMWMNQTHEASSNAVQDCYKELTAHRGIPKKLCERNLYFKKEICKSLTVEGRFQGSLSECVKSNGSVPVVVREGL